MEPGLLLTGIHSAKETTDPMKGMNAQRSRIKDKPVIKASVARCQAGTLKAMNVSGMRRGSVKLPGSWQHTASLRKDCPGRQPQHLGLARLTKKSNSKNDAADASGSTDFLLCTIPQSTVYDSEKWLTSHIVESPAA